ncbi:nuclear pore complex assembly-domain-containing protein [Russula earlei]|uniref:Nuclear pore complex assembly-domain-containing protein n=1 Tax=Russula earlei TaxID=71964 RepID=A0ACC0UDS1_9AGAM|nr:nuclear pore complex assembly-domain-containing protein [Russula earlei]
MPLISSVRRLVKKEKGNNLLFCSLQSRDTRGCPPSVALRWHGAYDNPICLCANNMDSMEEEPLEGDLMSLFDVSAEGFPWRTPRPHEIETRRAQLSDLLIFDILLSSGGIRHPDTLWPPNDPASLRKLLDAIEDSTYDALKKDCLIYFLLKWHQDGREERFREGRCIPPQFAMLSDAYWHLDSGIQVEKAVSLLCDVRLNRDYSSKIIQAISLSGTSARLLLQYLRTAKPMLTEPDDMDTYILALAEDGLINAWQYQRRFTDNSEIQTRLLKKLFEWCFTPKPRPEHLKQLISFPLSSFEQSLLHSFALEPSASFPVSFIPILQDLVCVRLIQSGQYLAAIKLDRQFASTRVGREAPTSQAAERRRKMIEDVIAALPSIERQEIEEQLRTSGQRKSGALIKLTPTQSNAAAAELSMSWEKIPPPRVPAITAGAPRFVLGRPTYGFDQPKAVTGHAKGVTPVYPVHSLLAPAPAQGAEGAVPPGLNGASYVPNPAPSVLLLPSSRAGPRVGLFGPGPQTSKPRLNSSGAREHRPPSLFAPRDTRPSISDQTKAVPPEEPPVGDSSLQKDVIPQFDAEISSDGEDQHGGPAQEPESAPVTEFSESVFISLRPELGQSHPMRETTEPLLPGAFRAEREAAQLEQIPFAHSPPTPPTRQRPVKSRRTIRTSVPGGFDEEATGEEDNVPPLPEVSRASRRRASRTSSIDAEEDNTPAKPRRSSRLSAASSSSEPSPQKISAPKKATRKTRGSAGSSAATGIASSTRSSTRRRR